jgi:hypothetical protein
MQLGEGNYNYYIQPKGTMVSGCKRPGFFREHYSHNKGDAVGKFEALSSARQIGNERLMKCVQPEQKNKAELMPFMQLFSNHHWSRIMQP